MLAEPTSAADWAIVLPVVLPLIAAACLIMLRSTRDLLSGFAILVAAAVAYCDFELLRRVLYEGPVSMTMGGWLPPFGISFTADIMGAGLAFIAALVTLAVLVFTLGERRQPNGKDGFHALVMLLLAGTSGAFLTGDLFNLYVWFEVMLISSFGLLVTGGRPVQLDATVKYAVLNFLGTTLFLLAVGLLYGALGTLNMADISLVVSRADPAVMASIGGLLLLAFGLKAAAFPVNTWLPASYHAPPAAIAALLVGLATKVGVYALLRTMLLLLPATRTILEPVLVSIAVATLLLAPLGAIAETNLRRALGFIVIGGIGAALAGLAIGTAGGTAGSIVYVAHAMLTMTALYVVAGLIERVTGETDSRAMGGLYATSSLISILFLVLVLAASGVPPFLGFWPKLMLLEASLSSSVATSSVDWARVPLVAALLLNALLTLIAGTRLWSHIFWRPLGDEQAAEVTPSGVSIGRRWYGLGAAGALTAIAAVLGLWPEPLVSAGTAAALDLLDPQRYIAAVGLGVVP